DGETRSGKRLALKNRLRNGKHCADFPHLVLEELAQRLDERQMHSFGQATDVVMAFDRRRRALEGYGFDDVGIERALREKRHIRYRPRLLLENLDERHTDDFSLTFGVVLAAQSL